MRVALALVVAALTLPSSASTFDDQVDLSIEYQSEDLHCLAMNIYHEARSENLAGKYAVADVVLNRVRDDRYPSTVCSVVYQAEHKPSWKDPTVLVPKRNRCQFSWYCDGKPDTPQDMDSWVNAQTIAWKMMQSKSYIGITEGATHYHAHYVNPKWAKELTVVGTIGNHKFYRWDRK